MEKKIIITSILYFGFAIASVCAQFGIRAGVNAAKLSRASMGGQTKHKMGVGIGIFREIPVSKKISIQPEINYMQQGTKETGDFTGGTLAATKKINYLQFPVLFKYNFNNGVFIQTGPYWGIGLGNIENDICFNGDCHSSKSGFESGGREGTLRYDHGFQLGTGFKITKNISIDLRLIFGLKNIYVKPYGGALNSGINISGSYSI
jgi:Outer membrane protein beta-barrel domain